MQELSDNTDEYIEITPWTGHFGRPQLIKVRPLITRPALNITGAPHIAPFDTDFSFTLESTPPLSIFDTDSACSLGVLSVKIDDMIVSGISASDMIVPNVKLNVSGYHNLTIYYSNVLTDIEVMIPNAVCSRCVCSV